MMETITAYFGLLVGFTPVKRHNSYLRVEKST